MKLLAILLSLFFLTGCGLKEEELDRAMDLRAKLLNAACSFRADITADYGDQLHSFSVYCEGDNKGNLGFQITAPETLADITGRIEAGAGKLTYRDMALAFPLLADDQLSPASAPWVFYAALRGGYLTAAGLEEELLRLTIDDSYDEDAMTVDIWLDEEDKPVRAEILYDGRRILTLVISEFQLTA